MVMNSMIPFSWSHADTNAGLPQIEWCRWNADGSYYVDWERTEHIARTTPYRFDLQQINGWMMASLLLAMRGRITEVTLAEADRIAEDRAAAYNKEAMTEVAKP